MTARGWSDHKLKITVFFASLVLYLAVGYWLQVRHGFIIGDALSRVSAAQTVLFSRDPHLAAIGFIFTPLTAMVQIPAIAISPLWPDMAERAFSGTIMSSIFMAGAVVQVFGMGADRGLPRAYSVAIAMLFAVNPMIVFYGSNGMSEAPFIFFMSWAVRRLIMWMLDDDVHHLIVAGGIAMGLAYLTRYDAVACIAAAGLLVGVTTYLRARPAPRFRRALLDLLMVSGPGFAAFIGWAAVSWLITGQAFAQFTSQYGNTAILEQSGQTKPGLRCRIGVRRRVHLAAGAHPGAHRGVGDRAAVAPAELAVVARPGNDIWCRTGLSGLQLRIRVDVSLPAVLHHRDPAQRVPGHAGGSRGPTHRHHTPRQLRAAAATA